jgi:RNA polymerase sigma factor (sigma-70 family)
VAVLEAPRRYQSTTGNTPAIPSDFQKVIRSALQHSASAKSFYTGVLSHQAEFYLAASVRWCQLRLELMLTGDRSEANLDRITKLISIFEKAHKRAGVQLADPSASTATIENDGDRFYSQNTDILNHAAEKVAEGKARKSGKGKYFDARDAMAGLGRNRSLAKSVEGLLHLSDSLASRLAAHNQGLVVNEASKDKRGVAERVANGNIGLLEGIVRFQPEQGFRLSTFVTNWIRKAISEAGHSEAGGIYSPRWIITEKNFANRTAASLNLNKIDPENAELVRRYQAERKIVSPEKAKFNLELAALAEIKQTIGLPSGYQEGLLTPNSEDPGEFAAQKDLTRKIRDALDQLEPAHARILRGRFGLDGKVPMTFKQIASLMGRSKARAQQLEVEAIEAMKQLLAGSDIK